MVLKFLRCFSKGIVVVLSLCACKSYNRNQSHLGVSNSSIEAGEKLSQKFCSQCHLMPDPSLLDAQSWAKGVLPQMGPRLGIESNGFEIYPSYKKDRNLPESYYPPKPLLTVLEWQHIVDYYTATAPDNLFQPTPTNINDRSDLFKIISPDTSFSNSATSFIKISDSSELKRLLVCDALKNTTYSFDKNLSVTDSFRTYSPVVDLKFSKNALLLCTIGILNPNNGNSGKIQIRQINENGTQSDTALFKDLQRPVEVIASDLNNDGKEDYLVAEFGFLTGKLSWFENTAIGFNKHILRPFAGALKSYITDVNKDGLPDIWTLFSQGEEGVFLFMNKGNNQFESSQVLRFQPSYGSSYFELVDFNKDGYQDILYTCGDNADYSPILKPYHGVYIFLNDKTHRFTQSFFYHINGCYKAVAKDFDGDNDLDLGCISFFPDLVNQPHEAFVYLENTGRENFLPHYIAGVPSSKWLTMDAGDFDKDGKIDIALGSFNYGPGSKGILKPGEKKPSFILLKNISHK